MARTVEELRRLVAWIAADQARMAAELSRLESVDSVLHGLTRAVYRELSSDHLARLIAEVGEFVDAHPTGIGG